MRGPWDSLLPTSVEVGGRPYGIRSDYRAILDICAALADPELDGQEKGAAVLEIFYPELEAIPTPRWREALEVCFRFIGGGEESAGPKGPKLVDWEQDFPRIIAPVNRVLGQEVRAAEYLHWWTFLAAYYEIGDCLFAQIVRIREKRARGKPLDKEDQEFYRRNRAMVDLQTTYTASEAQVLGQWVGQ